MIDKTVMANDIIFKEMYFYAITWVFTSEKHSNNTKCAYCVNKTIQCAVYVCEHVQ